MLDACQPLSAMFLASFYVVRKSQKEVKSNKYGKRYTHQIHNHTEHRLISILIDVHRETTIIDLKSRVDKKKKYKLARWILKATLR